MPSTLTAAEALHFLTGYDNTPEQAREILDTMTHYGIDPTSQNLRRWAHTAH